MEEQFVVYHRCLKSATKEPSRIIKFELVLEKNETIRSIWLKTKWRYQFARIYGDEKFIGDWYPEFNDMISQFMSPVQKHDLYLKLTGRMNDPESEEGTTTFILPLMVAYDTATTLGSISKLHKNITLEYYFTQVISEVELFVEIKT